MFTALILQYQSAVPVVAHSALRAFPLNTCTVGAEFASANRMYSTAPTTDAQVAVNFLGLTTMVGIFKAGEYVFVMAPMSPTPSLSSGTDTAPVSRTDTIEMLLSEIVFVYAEAVTPEALFTSGVHSNEGLSVKYVLLPPGPVMVTLYPARSDASGCDPAVHPKISVSVDHVPVSAVGGTATEVGLELLY
jgi:hypothetical protein